MITSSQIQEVLYSHKEELFKLGVQKLFLFGSIARRENTKDSDVDILVRFNSGQKNFDNFMDLSFRLEDILKVHVDLLTEDSISGSVRDSILAEAVDIEI
ncbi:nucleotidyltransferase family protein [Leptospira inadai]|uniref:Nucleotidyltransferase n=2 Tax=Leptospira inadai serovar Lyme TaxID=293084 RepID=A0ABX4YFK6_9LEPT|nr:nucleotidyltransferase domain-containing protein [Leptospira inadai]PNV74030.1 nucleotidyltransferase [Leptospira inadai serovar Lyme]